MNGKPSHKRSEKGQAMLGLLLFVAFLGLLGYALVTAGIVHVVGTEAVEGANLIFNSIP